MIQTTEEYNAIQWMARLNLGKVQQMILHYFGKKDVIHPTIAQTVFLHKRRAEITEKFYNNTILSQSNKMIFEFDVAKSNNMSVVGKCIRDTINKTIFGINRQWNRSVVRENSEAILLELTRFDGINTIVDAVLLDIRNKINTHTK